MEQNYALVDSTTALVINVIVWDGTSEFVPGEGVYMVPLTFVEETDEETGETVRRYTGGIGWTHNPKATVHKFIDNRPKEEEPK